MESEFFNIEVVDEVFVFAALRHPGFSFDLPLNIKVDAEFYNVEVVEEFFCVEVVEEVFVFAAIRLLLRGCRAPPHSSRLQGSRSVFVQF